MALSHYYSRLRFPIVMALLLASVTINVLLARKLSDSEHTRGLVVQKERLSIGTQVPSISVNRLGGQPELISYNAADRPTVLYVFTPPCSWCARNLDNFKTLVEKENGQYRIVGLSLSDVGLAEYVSKNGLKLPVYSGLSSETLKTYKLGSTPQTIVVSPEGKVLQNWMGAYVGEQKDEIEAYFHVKLPGLREAKQ